MPGKSDPLNQRATLWLDRDANEIARERYWHAWLESLRKADLEWRSWQAVPSGEPVNVTVTRETMSIDDARRQWEIAWAAAVAVHSFITEGRLGPPVDDDTQP